MSSIKCQPCLVEPCSWNLTLTPFKPSDDSDTDPGENFQVQENNFNSFSTSTNNKDIEKDSWSFLLALNNKSERTQKTETEKIFVHPLAKRSSSMPSQKSLEMCTENLGSETGCEMSITESYNNDIALFFEETEKLLPTKLKSNENWVSKRQKRSVSNFPPPLSSISSSSSLRMRAYREDGRLVLTAIPGCFSYFEAERSNGRLKLTLFDTFSPNCDNEAETEEEQEELEEVLEEENPEEIKENKKLLDEEDEQVEITEGEENRVEDKEINSDLEEGEMGVVKRNNQICRCKEGGCGNKQVMMYREQFWVAT